MLQHDIELHSQRHSVATEVGHSTECVTEESKMVHAATLHITMITELWGDLSHHRKFLID